MCVLYKNNSMTQKIWFKKKSPLHGSGLFAKTNIKKGQKIIQYIGDKVTKREGDKRAVTVMLIIILQNLLITHVILIVK